MVLVVHTEKDAVEIKGLMTATPVVGYAVAEEPVLHSAKLFCSLQLYSEGDGANSLILHQSLGGSWEIRRWVDMALR